MVESFRSLAPPRDENEALTVCKRRTKFDVRFGFSFDKAIYVAIAPIISQP
jgi:hypothetical protein